MLSCDLYRQFMAHCLRWAKAARNDKDREKYLQLARTWHEAALHIERGLGLIEEGEDTWSSGLGRWAVREGIALIRNSLCSRLSRRQ
jgi:hypothetical protein